MKRLLFMAGALAFAAYSYAPTLSVPPRSAGKASVTQPGTVRSENAGDASLNAMQATAIDRDSSGQFHLSVLVNGEDVNFLIDTGADTVALTVDDAQRLGFDIDPDSFEPISQTASGTGYGTIVELDRIELGGDEFRNVQAMVIGGLGTNLLGQSVLAKLGKVELQGDRMIIYHQ